MYYLTILLTNYKVPIVKLKENFRASYPSHPVYVAIFRQFLRLFLHNNYSLHWFYQVYLKVVL